VAFHAAQFGCRGAVVSRVGCDPAGDELLSFIRERGLETSGIQRDPVHRTGEVTVDLSVPDHPRYTIHEPVAWDFLEPAESSLLLACQADAICFGTLAQRNSQSRSTIHALLARCSPACLVVYDVNLRQQFFAREWVARSLARARIVKFNLEEAVRLADLLELPVHAPADVAKAVRCEYDVPLVCVTRAEHGCLLVGDGEPVDLSGRAVSVVDAVGAGDAFTAALIAARLAHWDLETSGRLANAVGGLVASRSGAMPELRLEFAELWAGRGRL
jgi:fructokinase